jgi:hypothetical protein
MGVLNMPLGAKAVQGTSLEATTLRTAGTSSSNYEAGNLFGGHGIGVIVGKDGSFSGRDVVDGIASRTPTR